MKKLILVIAALASLAGCNNKNKQNAAAQRVKQATIDSINFANAQQRKIDSLEALARAAQNNSTIERPAMTPLQDAPRKTSAKRPIHRSGHTTTAPTTAPASQPAGSVNNANPAPADNTTVAPSPEKKKGLNNAAKGAIIGLGTGAAAGAIIGKENRGKGAVIGGVVGAIGGAVGGAVLDKRKAKKAAERDSLRRDSLRRSNQ